MKRTRQEVLNIIRGIHLNTVLKTIKRRSKLRRYKLSLDKNKPNIEQL